MTAADRIIALTRDARLSPYAMSAIPAWLWAADATRVIWANATGAAVLKAASPAALSERIFETQEELAADIARVAAALPTSGAPRLERLRGIGSNLVCTCSRLTLADGYGILVVGSEPARPTLPLPERASRLFAASSEPLAVFSAEGALLYATGDLDADTTLATLGADALKTQALSAGRASGTSALGTLALDKIGNGAATVLLATLPDARRSTEPRPEQASEQAAEEEITPPATPSSPVEEAPTEAIAESAFTPSEPPAAPAPPADTPAAASTDIPAPERRVPLRFVWTMDAAQRFNVATAAFAEQMGARTRDALGKPWSEIAAALSIDAENRVANAVASRDTWSGVTIAWPTETGERVTVELSGLPIFDRERSFQGYRGFGVCRDGARAGSAPPVQATPPAQPEPPKDESRPLLTVVPAAKNVVPFRGGAPSEKRPALTPVERSAFNEIAEALAKGEAPPVTPEPEAKLAEPEKPAPPAPPPLPGTLPSAFATAVDVPALRNGEAEHAILERLPVGVLIHRNENLIYANRAFLEWTGYADLAAVTAAGGLERLVADPSAGALDRTNGTGKTFTIATRTGDTLICEGRLYSVPWQAESALMLVLVRTAAADRLRDSETALRAAEAETRELRSILDTATDGVIVTDRDGLVLAFNRSAEALFGYEYHEMARRPFTELFAPESERAARDYLDGLTKNGVASVLNDGREVIGRVRQGGLIPLFMTMGPIGVGSPKFCAVLRDITQWKRAEEDLLNAKRTAERASSAKSDFLAKISHEIRTPLNAILGFSEVMMNEQFGPLGSDRYREYMKDVHQSGEHLVSLINDLLDLSKIEAGKLDLVFASVNLNELVRQCVALMQPQANQQRIIIRSSLSPTLPPVVADARSVRQIVLNLLSNSIKFTGAGGQVIISTALTDRAEAILRVRDTGIGMTEKEIETAMEPFRQLATSTRYGSGGTGLGLPLTKALAEANRASFAIKSAVDAGTLVEITFPGTRVLAE
jgi:PAS domain S-box-containing protein